MLAMLELGSFASRLLMKLGLYDKFRAFSPDFKDVIRGSSVAFSLKVFGIGLNFIFNLYLVRVLGAENTGLYYLALTVMVMGVTVGCLGLENTLLRFIASKSSIRDFSAVKGVYNKSMVIALASSCVVAIILFISSPWLSDTVFSKPDLAQPLRYLSAGIVPMTFVILYGEILKGMGKIKGSLLVNSVLIPAFSLLAFAALGNRYGITGAALSFLAGLILTASMGHALWKIASPHLSNVIGSFSTRAIFNSSIPLLWVSVMNILITWTSTFALGIFGTKADVGVFGVAFRISMLVSVALIAVNSLVTPRFAALYEKKDLRSMETLAQNSAKIMLLLSLPLFVLFLFTPAWVMGIFGAEFRTGALLLVILSFGQMVNVSTGSVGYILIMSGNEDIVRKNAILAAAIAIAFNALLVPMTGAVGAAIAFSISLACKNLIASYLVWKKLKIRIIPFLGKSVPEPELPLE